MNVFGHIEFGENGAVNEDAPAGEHSSAPIPEPSQSEAPIVREMREIVQGLNPRNSGESYHDAVAKKEQALTMFKLGILGLEERATVEGLFWRLCRRLVEINKKRKRVPGPTRDLGDKLADQYMANFSLFQSAPDHWAINQLFPIVPLHRHLEAPTRDSTIVDITCDSDGKIDTFIEQEDVDETIALHPLVPGKPYYLGLFLTGAYQDIMGDMHNLFGRVHEVHVFVDDDDPEDYYIEEVIPGDTVERVLQRVQYEPTDLAKRIKQALDAKVREGNVKPKESVQLTDFYEQAMRGYTYLASE
jgi:arginine decarboxylase